MVILPFFKRDCNNNTKKTSSNKALRGNSPQNPNATARLRGAASVPSINAPRYKILHPVQTPTMNKAQVRTLPVLYLFDSINTTIPSGRYTNVTQWRVTERYAHTFSNTKIIDAWKRESSSKGLTEVLNDTLTSDPFTSITFVFNPTRNGVTVNAESFYYRLSDGRWIPNDPDISNKFAYSLHLEDLNFTNTKEVMNSNDDFKVFPNPTDNTMNISCQLDYLPSTLRIDIFDATGRMIHHQILPPLETTLTTIDSKDWVKGAYLVRLTADGRAFYKKIIKI
jgi:Secretion system C-terminal sorting domain